MISRSFGFLPSFDESVKCGTYVSALVQPESEMATIYLSSTYEDLKDHARAMLKVLLTIVGLVISCGESM